jgi:hypothetical protein
VPILAPKEPFCAGDYLLTIAYLIKYVNRLGLFGGRLARFSNVFIKTQSINAITIFDTLTILSPQYCGERISLYRFAEFGVKRLATVSVRYSDHKAISTL